MPQPHCVAKSFKKANTHNLELDGLAFELNGANLKVDTDRGNVALGVGVVRETEQEAGLGQIFNMISCGIGSGED